MNAFFFLAHKNPGLIVTTRTENSRRVCHKVTRKIFPVANTESHSPHSHKTKPYKFTLLTISMIDLLLKVRSIISNDTTTDAVEEKPFSIIKPTYILGSFEFRTFTSIGFSLTCFFILFLYRKNSTCRKRMLRPLTGKQKFHITTEKLRKTLYKRDFIEIELFPWLHILY